MDNIILRKTLSLIWRLLIIYSIYFLLRGHNEPGGGFIGGLLCALGILLRGYITASKKLEDKLMAYFPRLLGFSLLIFIAIILLPSLLGQEVLKGIWTTVWLPIAGKFSSVLVFDLLVYLVVAASAVYANLALSASASGDAS